MVYDFWQSERESAEVLPNGLKVLRGETAGGKPTAHIFKPKATKPWYKYAFRSVEAREDFVTKVAAAFEGYQERKKQYRVQRATGDPSLLKVGTALYYSWGYDQTNIEYWQVVRQSGKFAWVRQICQEVVEQTGFMSENVRPAVDQFTEPPCAVCGGQSWWTRHGNHGAHEHEYVAGPPVILKKLIQFYGGQPSLAMEHGSLTPVKVLRFADGTPPLVEAKHHQSHYH